MNKLLDKKVDCLSVITNIKIESFISMVEEAYKNRGGISGQRDTLKQKTAIVIRHRMIDDIKEGAVLPPIVLGVVVSKDDFDKLVNDEIKIEEYLTKNIDDNISIIDGMQRTSAIIKAVESNKCILTNDVRVEYWISHNSNSLLYRMLVLNTGQVPWNMKRQIEVIFNGIVKEIENKVSGIEILRVDENARRTKSGQYQASDLVELFLAFGSKTWKVNTKEKLTDEFTRHDFIQSSGETDLVKLFCDVLEYLYKFDKALDRFADDSNIEEQGVKFKNGKDLFKTQTARIGFISSISEKILGRPGIEKSKEEMEEEKIRFINAMNKVITYMDMLDNNGLKLFLDFETLNQIIDRRASKIGDYERELFYNAFKVLWEEKGELRSLEPCWRAL